MSAPRPLIPAVGGDPWRDYREWSIDVVRGPSPFGLDPVSPQPALTGRDVRDRDARFVADPFLLRHDAGWELYFEVLLAASGKGVIGRATSIDGLTWTYDHIVLEEPFHLAYPQVFPWNGQVWLVPETLGAEAVRLYRLRCDRSTFDWVADLLPGRWADPSLLHHAGRWWMWACSTPFQNRTLQLFSADDLLGPWHEHPASPIVTDDKTRARPGGRVIVVDGRPVRFAQDCLPRYGSRLRAFEILRLDAEGYEERERPESPVLEGSGRGWNANGMHHLDPHRLEDGTWIAAVDGDRYDFED